jgi:hypothetical protein
MSNAASSIFLFKDDNFKDTIIDTGQPLINMTDQSVIFIKDEFYFA